MKRAVLMSLILVGLLTVGCQEKLAPTAVKKYEPTWESLRQYREVPQWLRDDKFGIYTHWGPYAVHAYGENTTWYSFALYMEPDGEKWNGSISILRMNCGKMILSFAGGIADEEFAHVYAT